MIYTVTLNPAMDKTVEIPSLTIDAVNRIASMRTDPGGKGINVSVMLGRLGVPNIAFGFVGGFTGNEISRLLRKEGVNTSFVRVGGLSRINVKLHADRETQFNGSGPEIGEKELAALIRRIRTLPEGSVLVLAGSAPRSRIGDVYGRILQAVADRKYLVVADAEGKSLREALEHSPFLVKPNRAEIESYFHMRAQTREELFTLAEALRGEGAANVVVSLGGEGAIMAAQTGERLFCPAPAGRAEDTVGAGDSLVAGFLAAYCAGADWRGCLAAGVAAGSASSFRAGLATREEVERLLSEG